MSINDHLTNPNSITTKDKLRQLLKEKRNTIVLIQLQELERLQKKDHLNDAETFYITKLYSHYIDEGLSKSYNYLNKF